jgi:hypothetical protein
MLFKCRIWFLQKGENTGSRWLKTDHGGKKKPLSELRSPHSRWRVLTRGTLWYKHDQTILYSSEITQRTHLEMSSIARNSLRSIARTAPRVHFSARSRTFATTSESATEKYLAEDKALQHHAAGKYTITYSLIIAYHSTEASNLWRKIRCVVATVAHKYLRNQHM